MDVEKNLENLFVDLDHVVINLQVNPDIQMRFENHLESIKYGKISIKYLLKFDIFTSIGIFDLISSISSSTDEKINGDRPKRHSIKLKKTSKYLY